MDTIQQWYYWIAQTDYPDDVTAALDVYGDTPQARQAAAEAAFIQLHNTLPDWGYMIPQFELADGVYIFGRSDPAQHN